MGAWQDARRVSLVNVSLVLLFGLIVLTAAGCKQGPPLAPSLGEAYIGPITVELRAELAPNAKVIATAQHGEKVDITQVRRRFVKVRLLNGKEGWTDQRKLITPAQMAQIESIEEGAAKLPTRGRATAFDVINIHADPDRFSASFYQVKPGTQVDVLGRRITERLATAPPLEPIVKPSPKQPKKAKKEKEKKAPRVPPPPMPEAPRLPSNWMELSKTDLPEEPKDEEPPTPKRYDDWTLVRTQAGKTGWVLTRMLQMAIPDDVAQYSEGARITFYQALAEVEDSEAGKKKHWLWTTSRGGTEADFDSFRVFIWNARRHRYETSYIERNLEGFFPVKVEGPKFTVLLKSKEGKFYTKTFQLEGYITRWLGNADASAPPDPLASLTKSAPAPAAPAGSPEAVSRSLKDKLSGWWKSWRKAS